MEELLVLNFTILSDLDRGQVKMKMPIYKFIPRSIQNWS